GPAHAREHHLPADGRELAVEREDDAEPGGVEDAGAGEVEDEVADAGADVLLAARLELGRVAEVERLADADDGDGRRGLLDREAHGGGGWRRDGGTRPGGCRVIETPRPLTNIVPRPDPWAQPSPAPPVPAAPR